MAQNLFKFDTESDYRTAKRHNLIVPNVCMVVENGKTYINGIMASKADAEAGDIIAFDVDGKMYFIKPEAFSETMCETYSPVAITVIPSTHTTNGDVIGMSLATMSLSTPTTGSDTDTVLQWGEAVDTATGYDGVVTISLDDVTNANATMYISEISHLPSDYFFDTNDGVDNIIDTYTKWISNLDTHTPSPYLKDGAKSPLYSTNSLSMNAFQQMDGTANKPSGIINQRSNPAIFACDNFAVSPYKSGHMWYLPSIGELGYVATRLGRIIYALAQVAKYNTTMVKVAPFGLRNLYWSSTQSADRTKVWCLNPTKGEISKATGNEELLVRAFARF